MATILKTMTAKTAAAAPVIEKMTGCGTCVRITGNRSANREDLARRESK
jgi:hypothetical protein